MRDKVLYRAIITQALQDAGKESDKNLDIFNKNDARAWLRGNTADFREICDLADMDVSYVIKKSKAAINNGCKWRKKG